MFVGHPEEMTFVVMLRVSIGIDPEQAIKEFTSFSKDRTAGDYGSCLSGELFLVMNPVDDFDDQLTALLDVVKTDDDARQKYLDILEAMGATDPRTAKYRRQLTARLF